MPGCAAQATEAYFEKHNVEEFLNGLVQKLAEDKPDSVSEYVANFMGGGGNSCAAQTGEVCTNGHPHWHKHNNYDQSAPKLMLFNSLTDSKMPFVPQDGHAVKW